MIKISKAKPNESQKIREFEESVWNEQCITSPYDIVFFVTYGYAFVAKDKDKIVGAIIAIKTKDDEIKITDWLVDEQYRRMGIGTKLYKRLKKEVGNLSIIAYVDSTNMPSFSGHLKLGFERFKKIKDPFYLGDKKDWWVLKSRPLKAPYSESIYQKIKILKQAGIFAENKDIAREIRLKKLVPTLEKGKNIVLDFEKVEGATQSFIHALISDLIRNYGNEVLDKIQFKSCNKTIKGIITIVVDYMQESHI